MNNLIQLRQHIHQHPELSGEERNTANTIRDFVEGYQPSQTIALGKTGLAFVFDSKTKGSTTMIRAELDALPIAEKNPLQYQSTKKNTAHLCGHDGHMTIVAGLAKDLAEHPPKKGKVVLLFQPAEETGEGAKAILEDPHFKAIRPDYIFALHNIPGVDLGTVITKDNTFAAASKGMTVKLYGKTSHAAEPEKGISPTDAIAEIINEVNKIKKHPELHFEEKILLTVIHIELGEIAFGTSPGYAEIRITLRAFNPSDFDILTTQVETQIQKIAKANGLKADINYSEVFPATVNSETCNTLIKQSAIAVGHKIETIDEAFSWSEDFGYFTQNIEGGFFGLGSGINQPALHNTNFDFPDQLIEKGIQIFKGIIKQINY
jgi:amidohydrolase